jgi:branched-chain amino acid transport system substrate-binding protein
MRISRRIEFFVAVLIVFFCIGAYPYPAFSAAKGPIKIGFIAATTGNFASFGGGMVKGFKLYLDEINWTVAGRKIEFIVEDESTNPAIAVTKTRKLIKNDGVHLVAGVFLQSSGYSVGPVCEEAKIPLVVTNNGADDLTQRKRSPYVMRVQWGAGGELGHIGAHYAYNKLGWRKALIFAMDYAWGHEVGGGFQDVFEHLGGKIIQKVWTPINTSDYDPFIPGLNREADGIVDVITGAATVRALKGLKASGHKWPIWGPGQATDETFLPALGDAADGVYTTFNYSAALDTPGNKAYKERYARVYKDTPAYSAAQNYTAAQWIVRAIKAVDGDVENKEKFLKALRAVEIPDSLSGPLKMDQYGAIVQNQYIRKTQKVNGVYQNTIVETYPLVNQFWPLDPVKYLAQPVYSRNFPDCKHCK